MSNPIPRLIFLALLLPGCVSSAQRTLSRRLNALDVTAGVYLQDQQGDRAGLDVKLSERFAK